MTYLKCLLEGFKVGEVDYKLLNDAEAERLEDWINRGLFNLLVTKYVDVITPFRQGGTKILFTELLGLCLAGQGNTRTQLRKIFDEFQSIEEKISGLKGQVDAGYKWVGMIKNRFLQVISETIKDAEVLQKLQNNVNSVTVDDVVRSEIELLLVMAKAKITFRVNRLEGLAKELFIKAIEGALRNHEKPEEIFENLIRFIESIYAYFYANAKKE